MNAQVLVVAVGLALTGCPAEFTSAAPVDAPEPDASSDETSSIADSADVPSSDTALPDTAATADATTDSATVVETTVDTGFCPDLDGDGESACAGDCHDGDKRVSAKQSAFFDVPYAGSSGASFDYNCSGKAEPRYPSLGSCGTPPSCKMTEGWKDAVPTCGATGNLIASCVVNPSTGLCWVSGWVETKQSCR